MGNTLLNYLNRRINKPVINVRNEKIPGPVITISREVGCSGLELAYALMNKLNSSEQHDSWKVLSKEIFRDSARELDLDPEKVARIFKQIDRTTFDEILHAFGEKRFKSDRKIKKTVIEVIRSYAEDGFCIIVGRAGNVIAADIKNSLHIRLVAPMEYRIRSIMHKNTLDRRDAIRFIAHEEKDRYAYRHAVMEKQPEGDEIFDITFDHSKFTTDEIVEMLLLAIKKRGILKDYNKKMDFF